MKKGFTLVELLAVIVILAVILVIAVPQINNVIKETRKNSLGSTAKLIAAKAEEKEVENEVLENNESITCADLVKLDDNYGNCTVTKNSTTGKWEVTIIGANKFSGYTCTGTKDNMSCTEGSSSTPEYVYSYGVVSTDYTYSVTNVSACETYLANSSSFLEYYGDATYASDVCNNNPSDFSGLIEYGYLRYSDVSSFVNRTKNSDFSTVYTDYTDVPWGYDETTERAPHFIRWNSDEGDFSKLSEAWVCTRYNDDLNCFKPHDYANEKLHIQEVFENGTCEVDQEVDDPFVGMITYTRCSDGDWNCSADSSGYVDCNYQVESGSSFCSLGGLHRPIDCG